MKNPAPTLPCAMERGFLGRLLGCSVWVHTSTGEDVHTRATLEPHWSCTRAALEPVRIHAESHPGAPCCSAGIDSGPSSLAAAGCAHDLLGSSFGRTGSYMVRACWRGRRAAYVPMVPRSWWRQAGLAQKKTLRGWSGASRLLPGHLLPVSLPFFTVLPLFLVSFLDDTFWGQIPFHL